MSSGLLVLLVLTPAALSGCLGADSVPEPPAPDAVSDHEELIVLLSPPDGGVGVPLPVTFHWRAPYLPGARFTVLAGTADRGLTEVTGCIEVVAPQCEAEAQIQPGQLYSWRVQAVDGSSEWWSRTATFAVEGTLAPLAETFFRENRTLYDVPLAKMPREGARGIQVGDKLAWHPYPVKATQYRIIAVTGNGTVEMCRTADTECSFPALPAGERFAWWIEVLDSDKLLAVTPAREGVFYTAPPPLVLLEPLPHEAVHGSTVRFGWSAQAAYEREPIDVYASIDDGEFQRVCSTTTTSCEVEFPELATVAWYATAFDGTTTTRTATLQVRTGGPPLAPTISYPADGAIDVPHRTSFRWQAAGDPTGEPVTYSVEVLHGDDWATVCHGIGGWCAHDVPVDAESVTWRVRSRDDSGKETVSTSSTFTPFRAHSNIALLEPRDGARGLDSLTKFAWTSDAVASHTTSMVEVLADDGTWQAICRTTDQSCSAEVGRGQAVTWRVRTEGLAAGTSPPSTFETKLPVVLLHGWTGDDSTWTTLAQALATQGHDVVHPVYVPANDEEHVPALARRVASQVDEDLAFLGYDEHQPFHVIAHSMGGLVARALVEQPGAGTSWDKSGWNRTEGEKLPLDWPKRVRSLTTVGTPHGGTLSIISMGCMVVGELTDQSWLGATCDDMSPRGDFLRKMGLAGHATIPYHLVAGVSEWGWASRYGNALMAGLCWSAHDGLICRTSAHHGSGTIHRVDGCHSFVVTVSVPKIPITPLCEGPLITDSRASRQVVEDILHQYGRGARSA